ncbi:flagellar biosynthesis protein FlhF [Paenibacillus sp. ACRRX]|uniref:flagellar biosynthesis protein FlhF n=1 Tax=Paenibacillus sp. ACRRX TaxID=2918206 RepID=UPI001EF3FA2D|nr:flagellar biosynthesis protein FlhF [Paenibacillus sp. ACRRX]MCG7407477.1 flagellar biosynthesis protein FlhF [Paenibacillus sp. ACRRX]
MRVKKYLVETMPEAMSQIRQELGKDAVIVSTKEVKSGGILGMFAKKMIEVTAAVDDSPAKQTPQPRPAARPAVPAAMARNAYAGKPPNPPKSPAVTQRHELASPAADQLDEALFKDLLQELRGGGEAKPAEPTQIAPATITNSVKAPVTQQEPWRDEIREVKEMVKSMLRKSEHENWTAYAKQLETRLLEQGITSELSYSIIDRAMSSCRTEGSAEPAPTLLHSRVESVLEEKLARQCKPGLSRSTNVVYFVGATGVGKTTTIAKLAADQMFHHQRKVGFITSDTYRIAAVEQLRTYASILNAPIEVVTSPNDLQRALESLQDCDLILMDTAGRNYRNDMHVNEINSMLKPVEGSETFLVLSLTSKTEDMMAIINRFAKHTIDRIIFTKADETDTCGSIVNLTDKTDIPFSYVTCGQNVPDDIKSFEPKEIIRLLLGD